MDAKLCDRCGKVYLFNDDGKFVDSEGKTVHINFNKITIYKGLLNKSNKTFDICKYCAKDFLDWMKSGDSQNAL